MNAKKKNPKNHAGTGSPEPVLPSRVRTVREQPGDDAHLIKKRLVAKVDTDGPQDARIICCLVSHTHVGCPQAFVPRIIPCSSKGCCHISLILPVSCQDKRASGAAWEPGVINPSPFLALTLHCQVGRG